MLVSGYLLKKSIENYQRDTKGDVRGCKEGYSHKDKPPAIFTLFLLVGAILLLIGELMVLFYAINSAIVCTRPGPERVVNIVMAITFPIPYMMINTLFNQCVRKNLRSSSWLPTNSP